MIKKTLLIINLSLLIALGASAVIINDITKTFVTPSDRDDGPTKLLVQFDLPDSIDDGCYIEHAEIVIVIEPETDGVGVGNPPELAICGVKRAWSYGTVNWDHVKNYIDEEQQVTQEYIVDEDGYVHWDITAFVRAWASGGANNGLITKPRRESDVFDINPLYPPRVEIEFFYVE
ncbi:DNRLRE domain-containing protein [bacterium]|nr:DNRLRE domain-containing protein [bacterium]